MAERESIDVAQEVLEEKLLMLESVTQVFGELAHKAGLDAPDWPWVVETLVRETSEALQAYFGEVMYVRYPERKGAESGKD